MTKFETIGSTYQLSAVTKDEALRAFQKSCHVCCMHGIRIDCDRCAIEHTHRMVLAAFDCKTCGKEQE